MAAILDPLFCVRCGGPMAKKVPPGDHRERHVCTKCDFVHYLDPKVACGSVPERNGKIVLIRRKIDPRAGFWSFPCGFMEIDETVEEAARRETEEETGLAVRLRDHLGTYSYADSWHGGCIVVVAFRCEIVRGEPVAGDDAAEARFFGLSEIPWDRLAFRSSHAALRDLLRSKGIDPPPGPV